MSAPALRRAAHADAKTLSELGRATFTTTFGHLYSPEDLDAFLTEYHSEAYYAALLVDPEMAAWIAEMPADGGEMAAIGYRTAGPCGLPAPDMADNSGELCRLYVDSSAQGSGLGTSMLKAALAWLEERYEHLYVGVFSENFGAQKLYQRHGFQKIAEYHFMVGNHADLEWIMKRS